MGKSELKLISIRMDERVLVKCAEFIQKHKYLTRSDLINRILLAVLYNFNDEQLYEMCNHWQWREYKVTAEFKTTTERRSKKL